MRKREKSNSTKHLSEKNKHHIFKDSDKNPSAAIIRAAASEKTDCLKILESSELGLDSAEVKIRIGKYGLNEVSHEKAPKWYVQLSQAFVNPFIGVLFLLSIISLITDVFIQAPADRDYKTVIVISIMVF